MQFGHILTMFLMCSIRISLEMLGGHAYWRALTVQMWGQGPMQGSKGWAQVQCSMPEALRKPRRLRFRCLSFENALELFI